MLGRFACRGASFIGWGWEKGMGRMVKSEGRESGWTRVSEKRSLPATDQGLNAPLSSDHLKGE